MKTLVISDIHGNSEYLKKVVDFYFLEHIDKVIVLGDSFSCFTCSSIYDRDVSKYFYQMCKDITYVMGNCDSGYAEELLPCHMLKEAYVDLNGKKALCFHGDRYVPIPEGTSFVLTGHTHIINLEKVDNVYYINPGSVGRSRDYSGGSFCIIGDNFITIYDLNYHVLEEVKF